MYGGRRRKVGLGLLIIEKRSAVGGFRVHQASARRSCAVTRVRPRLHRLPAPAAAQPEHGTASHDAVKMAAVTAKLASQFLGGSLRTQLH